MWSIEESSTLIISIENQVLRAIPVTSTNNNHEFTGNLLEIARDWNLIANSLGRTGELEKTSLTKYRKKNSCFFNGHSNETNFFSI